MKTIVINCISGPCSGKSTCCAGIFTKLKKLGVNCELALEYAKDCVWNESYATMNDQVYVFGQQYHRIWRLQNKVNVVIVDSPLPLSIIYNKIDNKYFEDFIIECYKSFNNRMYFIERNEVFMESGRVHSLEQSIAIDNQIKELLNKHDISFKVLKNNIAVDEIVAEITEELIKEGVLAK